MESKNRRIHEEAAMWILPFFVKDALATILNNCVSAATHIAPVIASVNTIEPMIQKKRFRSNLEVVNYLVKKFANNQEITERNSTILLYTQPASITPIQYADNSIPESCKVADVYDEST